jgi:adenine-specific DNA-methyltransferase
MTSSGPNREHVSRETADIRSEQIERLKELFPQAVTEGKIDFEGLRTTLGDQVDESPERYTFTWAGRREATRLLQMPSRATLVPVPEESVNFDDTGHVFIEGDNLEVLKLLYKSYFGRVKMVYIDPPYNTGNDFIYCDNFVDPLDTYLRLTGQKGGDGNLLTTNPETSGRYHSSWLSMMYPRLFLGRQLLREDGVMFVSIDDHEVHNLLMMMNEVFGEENQLGIFLWKSRAKPTNAGDAIYKPQRVGEYVLAYARNSARAAFYALLSGEKRSYPHVDTAHRRYRTTTILTSNRGRYRRETMRFELAGFKPSKDQRWKAGPDVINQLYADGYIEFREGTPFRKHYEDEEKEEHDPLWAFLPEDWTGTAESGKSELTQLVGTAHGLDSVKPVPLITIFLQAVTASTDIVMDFFAGSCTTAQAVLELNRQEGANRRFIMVQLPETTGNEQFPTIAEIGKTRLRQVIQRMKNEGQANQDQQEEGKPPEDLGFRVFRLAESSYRSWAGVEESQPEAYAAQMELYADPLVAGWNPHNVIYEVAIKEGYSLTSRIEKLSGVDGHTVYRVSDPDQEQSFHICLDDALSKDVVKSLALTAEDLFVCRDVALDDELAANLALQCRLKTI